MTRAVETATGAPTKSLKLEWAPGASAGGGGASVGALKPKGAAEKQYFYKSASFSKFDMLHAEFLAIKEIDSTATIRVPKAIACGVSNNNAYAIYEYLNMGAPKTGAIAKRMGRDLAQLHKISKSPEGQFGFMVNNTCGATPQPNPWTESWVDFWMTQRLDHMLKLCRRDGAVFPHEKMCLEKIREVLEDHVKRHHVPPALCHGDLWSGNAGATVDGEPCIFDPAAYFADREVDVAMTALFGRFADEFYEGYEEEWPLDDGFWEERVTIYNLYHILNHYVLFGGSYLSQAQGMMGRILSR